MANESGELGLLDRVTLKSDTVGVIVGEDVLSKIALCVLFIVVSDGEVNNNLLKTVSTIVDIYSMLSSVGGRWV